MQYSTFYYRKKAVPVKTIGWLLKGIVLLLMIYFIQLKWQQGHLSFGELSRYGLSLYKGHSILMLLLPVVLIFVNWGLEALKWQLLSAPVSAVSLRQAMRAVLTGLSMGFVTPRSLGDYAGRLLEADAKGRERLVGAVFLNRLSQSLPTYLFGLAGLLYLWDYIAFGAEVYWLWLMAALAGAALGGAILLGKGRHRLLKQLQRFKGELGKALQRMFQVLGEYRSKEIILLLFYAGLRYAVFSVQFVWLLRLSGVSLPLNLIMAGVAVIYFVKSIIPAFNFLSDLGVRELSAIWVFSGFALPENQLLLASLLLWCMNILFPALLGTVNVLRLRIRRI